MHLARELNCQGRSSQYLKMTQNTSKSALKMHLLWDDVVDHEDQVEN